MPVYPYECQKCGRSEERVFKMGLAPDTVKSMGCTEGEQDCDMDRVLAASRVNVVGGTPTHHHRAPRR